MTVLLTNRLHHRSQKRTRSRYRQKAFTRSDYGTVGQVVVKEGDKVTVRLHDENGRPIDVTGIIKAILEED